MVNITNKLFKLVNAETCPSSVLLEMTGLFLVNMVNAETCPSSVLLEMTGLFLVNMVNAETCPSSVLLEMTGLFLVNMVNAVTCPSSVLLEMTSRVCLVAHGEIVKSWVFWSLSQMFTEKCFVLGCTGCFTC